jgi:signal peptidase
MAMALTIGSGATATRRSRREEARANAPVRRLGRGAVRLVLAVVLAAAVAAFLFLAVGPRVLGYQTSTMLTGSMSPLINPGDVVVSVRTPVASLKTGDIITYHIPVQDGRVETHRIASITRTAAGATTVITKGDANSVADPWTATLTDNYVYTSAGIVPKLGYVIRAFSTPIVKGVLMYAAPAGVVALALTSIWGRPRKEAPDVAGVQANDRIHVPDGGQ